MVPDSSLLTVHHTRIDLVSLSFPTLL